MIYSILSPQNVRISAFPIHRLYDFDTPQF